MGKKGVNNRLINREDLRLAPKEYTLLSYESVFNPGYGEAEDLIARQADLEKALKEKEQQWQQSLENEIRQVREQGYNEGLVRGKEQTLQEIHTHLAPLTEALAAANEQLETFFEDLKPMVSSLVFELAERVVEIPLTRNEKLTQLVSEKLTGFLQKVKAESEIRIRVSETDYEAVVAEIAGNQEYKHVHIQSDASLNHGEYEIETDYEEIVQRFPLMVRQFRESIEPAS